MPDVQSLMDKGNKYYDGERYNDALDIYFRILDIEPENIDGLINVGLCYRHLEKYDEAIDYYNKVLDIEADNKTALNNKGYVYEVRGELEKAIVLYEKSLEIDPNYDRPLVNLTNIYIDRKEYEKTIPIYKNALDIDHLNVPNWIDLGRAHRFLENYPESINAYNNALRIDPFSKIAWNNLGYAYYCMKDFDNSIRCYTKSLKIEWIYDLPFVNMIKVYKDMIADNDNNAKRWYNIAKGFFIGRAYNRAIDSILKALEIEPLSGDFKKLKKEILDIKKKNSFEQNVKTKIAEVLEMFSFTATSAYVSDVIGYIQYKLDNNVFTEEEIMFKILETIDEKGLWVKLDEDKLRFYKRDDGQGKVIYK